MPLGFVTSSTTGSGRNGRGISSVSFTDNSDGTVDISFNMSDGSVEGPFTGSILSDTISVNQLTVEPSTDGERLTVKNAADTKILYVNTSSNGYCIVGGDNDSTKLSVLQSDDTNIFTCDTVAPEIIMYAPNRINGNSTQMFLVENSANTDIFNVDTTTSRITIPDTSSTSTASLVFANTTQTGFGSASADNISIYHANGESFRFERYAFLCFNNTSLGFTTNRWRQLNAQNIDMSCGSSILPAKLYRQTNTTSDRIIECYSNVSGTGVLHMYVEADGDIINTNGTYTSPSDIRYKTNVESVTVGSYSDKILQLDLINYDFVDGSNGNGKLLGFSAQQIQSVFGAETKLVKTTTKTKQVWNEETGDWEEQIDTSVDANGEQLTVKYSILNLMLHDVVKKQQQLIEDLTSRVAELETDYTNLIAENQNQEVRIINLEDSVGI